MNPLYITFILYLSTTKDKGGKEDAQNVPNQSYQIKDLSNCGYRISEISEKIDVDSKTIRKYLMQEDFGEADSYETGKSWRSWSLSPGRRTLCSMAR